MFCNFALDLLKIIVAFFDLMCSGTSCIVCIFLTPFKGYFLLATLLSECVTHGRQKGAEAILRTPPGFPWDSLTCAARCTLVRMLFSVLRGTSRSVCLAATAGLSLDRRTLGCDLLHTARKQRPRQLSLPMQQYHGVSIIIVFQCAHVIEPTAKEKRSQDKMMWKFTTFGIILSAVYRDAVAASFPRAKGNWISREICHQILEHYTKCNQTTFVLPLCVDCQLSCWLCWIWPVLLVFYLTVTCLIVFCWIGFD